LGEWIGYHDYHATIILSGHSLRLSQQHLSLSQRAITLSEQHYMLSHAPLWLSELAVMLSEGPILLSHTCSWLRVLTILLSYCCFRKVMSGLLIMLSPVIEQAVYFFLFSIKSIVPLDDISHNNSQKLLFERVREIWS